MKRLVVAVAAVCVVGGVPTVGHGQSYKKALDKAVAGKEPSRVCFAWSAKLKQLACYDYGFETENAPSYGPLTWAIALLSTVTGKQVARFEVRASPGTPENQKITAKPAGIKKAKAALVRGGFVAFRGRGRALYGAGTRARVGGITLRVRRTKEDESSIEHTDELQAYCGGKWTKLLVIGPSYGLQQNASRSASATGYMTPNGKLLVTVNVSTRSWNGWGSDDTSGRIVSVPANCKNALSVNAVPMLQFDPPSAARASKAKRLNNLGYRLERSGKRKAALAKYRAAVVADPSFLLARYNMAAAMVATGKPKKGLLALKAFYVKDCPICLGFLVHARKDKDFKSVRGVRLYKQLTWRKRIRNPKLKVAAENFVSSFQQSMLTTEGKKLIHPRKPIVWRIKGSLATTYRKAGRQGVAALMVSLSQDRDASSGDVARCSKSCCTVSVPGDDQPNDSIFLKKVCFAKGVGDALYVRSVVVGPR